MSGRITAGIPSDIQPPSLCSPVLEKEKSDHSNSCICPMSLSACPGHRGGSFEPRGDEPALWDLQIDKRPLLFKTKQNYGIRVSEDMSKNLFHS